MQTATVARSGGYRHRPVQVVEASTPAPPYSSDAVAPSQTLVYDPGQHAVAPGKRQTYSVAADNAEVRPYRALLGRRSRCFARSLDALRRAVTLCIHAWNRRHLHTRAYPRFAGHVRDFVEPLA